MGEKIVVGPVNRGLRNDRTAFVIDNDSFPTMINAYQWRGRVKRKRGTSLLTRLTRYFNSTDLAYSSTATIPLVSGGVNILTGFGLQADGNIVPGSVVINNVTVAQQYTDPGRDSILVGSLGGSGTINYATGAITIAGGGTNSINATFKYTPDLPVMGLEDLTITSSIFPKTIAFDTTYSYSILNSYPYSSYDVSFYKNPASATINGIAYTQKTDPTPVTWNGDDYRQFWTTNYQAAMWATNGINVPFVTPNISMQFQKPATSARNSNDQMTFTINNCPLVVGDWVFVNEFISGTAANASFLNFQTGFVTSVTTVGIVSTVVVRFPFATIPADTYTSGMIQYLTNRSNPAKDCLRWYDGDPTNGDPNNPLFVAGRGWVNFCPPISLTTVSIDDAQASKYYLVGARMIFPFKDRLLFIGPCIQTSDGSDPIYLEDTIIYSQNGTPYYTASFIGGASALTSPKTVYNPLLTPFISDSSTQVQTATPNSYFSDVSGFGGFVVAGLSQPILTVSSNEDVLVLGLSNTQIRLVYTSNDLVPFNFFTINSELGSESTFSAVNLDRGVISVGGRGIILTTQISSERVDLQIPDQIFQFNLTNNGSLRVCAQRDFINEWIYFTYPKNQNTVVYPNQTLQYNYRDQSWAIFNESYTTYGAFRKVDGYTWNNIGETFSSWNVWNEPWEAGSTTLLQPQVIGGNQQGFVLIRDDGTNEGKSLYIQNIVSTLVTSPNHGLTNGDFIIILGCIGTISDYVNGFTFQVGKASVDTFQLFKFGDNEFTIPNTATYTGTGTIVRTYRPFIQTKQFPVAWDMGRKTRIGPQMYLLTTTQKGEISLLIYLSQNANNPYNASSNFIQGPIYPEANSFNTGIIYGTTLYTCPESENIGLTPANTNLQMPTAAAQAQIWHRINTSLIGDTVQLGFTLSDEQMAELKEFGDPIQITNATQAANCVITCVNTFAIGQLVKISNVLGMTQLNGNVYSIINASSSQITIDVNSTGFDAYISGGLVTLVGSVQFSEIELHGFVIDVNQSQVLA